MTDAIRRVLEKTAIYWDLPGADTILEKLKW